MTLPTFSFEHIYKSFMVLKFISITSAFLLSLSLSSYGACSYFFSVSYVVFFYARSHTVVHRADGQSGALIIGSAGCTVHDTSGRPGLDVSVYAAESDPALLHRKKYVKFSCVLLARLSALYEAVHIADKPICIGHITSFVSVTLMTLRLGFNHNRGVYVDALKLNVEYSLFNFITNLD